MKEERTAMHMSGKGKKWGMLGFPGGLVVENLPTNEEVMDLIPGAANSHMRWNN